MRRGAQNNLLHVSYSIADRILVTFTDMEIAHAGRAIRRTRHVGLYVTELPRVGSTEVWEFLNATVDAHPIHIHLVQFQLINRQAVVIDSSTGQPTYLATWAAAFPGGTFNGEASDGSWSSVTYAAGTVIPGYGPPNDYFKANADGALGGNLAFSPFDPTTGPGYMVHCHILDHEDNEMMRPYFPVSYKHAAMSGMNSGLNAGSPVLIAAFRSALLHQLGIVTAIFVLLLAYGMARNWRAASGQQTRPLPPAVGRHPL